MASCVSAGRLEEEAEHIYSTMADTTFACELTLRSIAASYIRDSEERSRMRQDLCAEIGSHVKPKTTREALQRTYLERCVRWVHVFTDACVRAAAPEVMYMTRVCLWQPQRWIFRWSAYIRAAFWLEAMIWRRVMALSTALAILISSLSRTLGLVIQPCNRGNTRNSRTLTDSAACLARVYTHHDLSCEATLGTGPWS